jgi:hypothetical protein
MVVLPQQRRPVHCTAHSTAQHKRQTVHSVMQSVYMPHANASPRGHHSTQVAKSLPSGQQYDVGLSLTTAAAAAARNPQL